MFNYYDAYVNALTEAQEPNKFNRMDSIDINDITVADVPLLYTCEYEVPFKNLVKCDKCGAVFNEDDIGTEEVEIHSFEDYWDYNRETPEQRDVTYSEDREVCPVCNYGSDEDDGEFEYSEVTIADLFDNVDAFDDYITVDVKQAIIDLLAKENNKTESIKTEHTLRAPYDRSKGQIDQIISLCDECKNKLGKEIVFDNTWANHYKLIVDGNEFEFSMYKDVINALKLLLV